MGGARERFPETRLSVLLGAADADPQVREAALETLVAGYWKPVYKYLRLKWRASNEDAKDLTQGFFTHLMEKELLSRFDPARAKFRTYLRLCLDGFVSNERKAAGRLKRGGGVRHVPLDFEGAEGELCHDDVPDDDHFEEFFRQEWLRSILARAVEALRSHCESTDRELAFSLFRRYDLEAPASDAELTYADLAREFEIDVTKVTNSLHATRRKFRELLLERLRESCASDEEFREEAAELLGIRAP
jgi:RNA polymerase sigma factor (sigma-70 family)